MEQENAAATPPAMMGYHGTTQSGADDIIRDDFKILDKPDYWLGKGAYFFADYPPAANGIEEATYWVNEFKKYRSWAIIEAEISTENQLNPIANQEHRLYIKKIRNVLFKKHIQAGKSARDFSENRIFLHIDKTDAFWSYVALFNPSRKPMKLILDLQVQVCVKDLRVVKKRKIVQKGRREA